MPTELTVHMRRPHASQAPFLDSEAKRIIVRAGRRGGKTVGAAIKAVERFAEGGRVLYATPTAEQHDRFWFEVSAALEEPIKAGLYKCNNSEHYIERPGTRNRIKAKTAWNADTLRGDDADLLILDEWQLMNEDAWEIVGAPMLLDNDGSALFIYTPPSLLNAGVSKARDPRHAAKMFQAAQEDKTGRWAAFHFTSHDNPHISRQALAEITRDMSAMAYRQEILAEDDDATIKLLVYGMFDERTQLIEQVPLFNWPRYTWHDFGASNPACLFAAQDPGGNLFIYDEYLPGPGRSIFQHVEEFRRRTEGVNVIKRIGGNQNTEAEIRQGYAAHGWPIVAPSEALKQPKTQIERVQALMGLHRIFVTKNCLNLMDELRNCLWETDKDGYRLDKVRNEARYHALACLRYGGSDFRPETAQNRVATKPKRYAYA